MESDFKMPPGDASHLLCDDESSSSTDVTPYASGAADSADDSSESSESAVAPEASIASAIVNSQQPAKYTTRSVLVAPNDRRTSTIMSLYEYTECRSIRATQISKYNNCFVSIDGLSDPIEMAERELRQRMSPIILRRCVGVTTDHAAAHITKYYEEFRANDMGFPQ